MDPRHLDLSQVARSLAQYHLTTTIILDRRNCVCILQERHGARTAEVHQIDRNLVGFLYLHYFFFFL